MVSKVSSTGTCSENEKTSTIGLNAITDDPVYVQTTQVLLAIKRLIEAVQQSATTKYLRMVRDVGTELRDLLAICDNLMPSLPVWSHREVEMAHKVLSSDMAGLIKAMQQALNNQLSTLVSECRRSMCQAAHTIVVDSKTLLDTVNSVRARAAFLERQLEFKEHSTTPTPPSSHPPPALPLDQRSSVSDSSSTRDLQTAT